jgi:aspartate kinase
VHSKKRTRAHGFLGSIFSILDKHGLSVDLISSSEVHVSMALHSEISLLSGQGEEELRIESESLRGAVDDLSSWGDVDLVPSMAIISLVGRQLRSMVSLFTPQYSDTQSFKHRHHYAHRRLLQRGLY